jgi:hypothetical protein
MKYSFQNHIKFSQGNNVLDAASCKIVVLFGETNVFLQLSGKCLFGANGVSLHLEKPKLQEVFLSKLI